MPWHLLTDFSFRDFFSSSKSVERRRLYRYAIPGQLASSLEIECTGKQTVQLRVIDVNVEAVSAQIKGIPTAKLKDLSGASCRLMVGELAFSFVAHVIRFAEDYVVLKFCEPSQPIRADLKNLFIRILGLSLDEKGAQEHVSDWIHGINYTDIFMQRGQGTTGTLQALTYLSEDHFYHWHQEGGVRTGEVKRELYAQGLSFSKRELNPIVYDESALLSRVKRLQQIINASDLRTDLREEILAVMKHD